MDINEFKTQLHTLFENCDYTKALTEDSKEKIKFTHTCPDGTVYNIEVEPTENEFYVFQDGKQVDLFNLNLVDQDGAVPKDKRQMIVKDYTDNHKAKDQSEAPVATDGKIEEMNMDIVNNMKKQYPEKSPEEIKSLYYATMNKHDQNPETGHKNP